MRKMFADPWLPSTCVPINLTRVTLNKVYMAKRVPCLHLPTMFASHLTPPSWQCLLPSWPTSTCVPNIFIWVTLKKHLWQKECPVFTCQQHPALLTMPELPSWPAAGESARLLVCPSLCYIQCMCLPDSSTPCVTWSSCITPRDTASLP